MCIIFLFVARKQLQISRAAKLSSLEGGSRQKPIEFVKKGKMFTFADLPSWMKVQFVGCSARGSNGDKGDGVADVKAVIRDWMC